MARDFDLRQSENSPCNVLCFLSAAEIRVQITCDGSHRDRQVRVRLNQVPQQNFCGRTGRIVVDIVIPSIAVDMAEIQAPSRDSRRIGDRDQPFPEDPADYLEGVDKPLQSY